MTAIGDAPKLGGALPAVRPVVTREHRSETETARNEGPAVVETKPEIGEYQNAVGLARDLHRRIIGDQPLAMAAQANQQEESLVNSLVG